MRVCACMHVYVLVCVRVCACERRHISAAAPLECHMRGNGQAPRHPLWARTGPGGGLCSGSGWAKAANTWDGAVQGLAAGTDQGQGRVCAQTGAAQGARILVGVTGGRG